MTFPWLTCSRHWLYLQCIHLLSPDARCAYRNKSTTCDGNLSRSVSLLLIMYSLNGIRYQPYCIIGHKQNACHSWVSNCNAMTKPEDFVFSLHPVRLPTLTSNTDREGPERGTLWVRWEDWTSVFELVSHWAVHWKMSKYFKFMEEWEAHGRDVVHPFF